MSRSVVVVVVVVAAPLSAEAHEQVAAQAALIVVYMCEGFSSVFIYAFRELRCYPLRCDYLD